MNCLWHLAWDLQTVIAIDVLWWEEPIFWVMHGPTGIDKSSMHMFFNSSKSLESVELTHQPSTRNNDRAIIKPCHT